MAMRIRSAPVVGRSAPLSPERIGGQRWVSILRQYSKLVAMQVAHSIEDARRFRCRLAGTTVLVPTMGALHGGHLAHLRCGRQIADHLLVSIFVNPTQFGPGEDFDRYPRSVEEDLALCESEAVDHVFVPSVDQMYSASISAVCLDVPDLTADLEGASRVGHFPGVCRVVLKLLGILGPDFATFGRKDYQQLCVIHALVRDLFLPVRIIEVGTVREEDGLAMSSRNRYLNTGQRRKAVGLYQALLRAREMIEQGGETDPARVEQQMAQTVLAHGLGLDYVAVRRPRTLMIPETIEPSSSGVVGLVAGSVDGIHLIDSLCIGGRTDQK